MVSACLRALKSVPTRDRGGRRWGGPGRPRGSGSRTLTEAPRALRSADCAPRGNPLPRLSAAGGAAGRRGQTGGGATRTAGVWGLPAGAGPRRPPPPPPAPALPAVPRPRRDLQLLGAVRVRVFLQERLGEAAPQGGAGCGS
ncbi:glutaredoxin 2 isoform X1 [Dasypus novemcinctus]|uniref:glutaredoxin 2 isoform X1 n=1 Tax=Dasypus novemcinctus TaxID=9361 RepID=UPI0039C9D019